MLELRRGTVVEVPHANARTARVTVELADGARRAAIAYPALTGAVERGDEVVVNVEAQELGLGSGGFDIVCVNLTRGLGGERKPGAHVMKLNYTPLQHSVDPVEQGLETAPSALGMPVVVLPLHGYLPAAAFAVSHHSPAARVGYVQSAGGALAGQLSNVVATLLGDDTLAGHVTVAPCFGGPGEAITVEGALHAAAERLGWEAAIVGPGPGIIGSASALGHGGLEALHNAHAALSLGCEVILAPRTSSGDPRERHRGLSHHSATVLGLLMRRVDVAVASGLSREARSQIEHAAATAAAHRLVEADVEQALRAYTQSELPATTMGRSIEQDPDFFRSALAAGMVLADRLEEEQT